MKMEKLPKEAKELYDNEILEKNKSIELVKKKLEKA
jgi:hypothetical protein